MSLNFRILRLFFVLFIICCVHHPSDSRAGIEEITGLGIRTQAMAGSGVALNEDSSASYYNPAGLTGLNFNDDIGFNMEMGFSTFNVNAHTDRSIRGTNTHDELEAVNAVNLNIGMDFGRHLSSYLNERDFIMGVTVLVPTDHFIWWRIQFPQEELHTFYYDYVHRFVLIAGFGIELTPWLSVGISENIHFEILFNTSAPITVDAEDLSDIISGLGGTSEDEVVDFSAEAGIYSDIMLVASPIIGVQVKPFDGFILGLTYRGEIYVDDYGEDMLTLTLDMEEMLGASVDFPITYNHHYAHYYTPDQWALGLSYKFTNGFLITTDVTYMKWSSFIDIFHQTPEEEFEDAYLPRLGLEKPVLKEKKFFGDLHFDMSLRAGYGFWNSPVPEQKGETNFLDTDKHIFALGCELILDNKAGKWQKPTCIQTMFQYHQMVERTYQKQETGEVLTLGGYAYNVGITMEVKF